MKKNTIGQSKVYQSDVIIFGIVLNRMRTIYAYTIDRFIFTYDRTFAIFACVVYDRGLVFEYRWVFLISNIACRLLLLPQQTNEVLVQYTIRQTIQAKEK